MDKEELDKFLGDLNSLVGQALDNVRVRVLLRGYHLQSLKVIHDALDEIIEFRKKTGEEG